MALRTSPQWLSVRLYYGEPWEEFLIKAVKPYTDVVLQTGVAERFYFKRSWERGPNIQLAFKGKPYILANMLRPNLDEHFLQYFESRPSFVKPPAYSETYPSNFKWHPNNSLNYSTKLVDNEDVEAKFEMELFAPQSEASSNLVLQTLKQKGNRWTYNEMLSAAIKMHLGFSYAMGMDLEESLAFFEFLYNNWFQSTYGVNQEEGVRAEASFKKIFNFQRKDMVPYHSALWELLKNYERMEDRTFVDWVNINANTAVELNFAVENRRLSRFPNSKYSTSSIPTAWRYYESLVQATNNRLGIFNKNEGFVLFLIAESMQATLKSNRNYARIGYS